jgi:hypothetical protein
MDRMRDVKNDVPVLSLTILFILSTLLSVYRIGSSRAFCTVRNAKLE